MTKQDLKRKGLHTRAERQEYWRRRNTTRAEMLTVVKPIRRAILKQRIFG